VDWIDVSQNSDRWQAVVNVRNLASQIELCSMELVTEHGRDNILQFENL
jgi:hypothetical protein